MSKKMDQTDVNDMIEQYKKTVIEQCRGESLSEGCMMYDVVTQMLAFYEFEAAPEIESVGLHAPTLKEIFGVDIKITEKPTV